MVTEDCAQMDNDEKSTARREKRMWDFILVSSLCAVLTPTAEQSSHVGH